MHSLNTTSDILIIGGGIIGMLSARELALGGADVTLLERQQSGRESSWAGGGIISPLYPWRYSDSITELAGWSQARYPELSRQLHDTTGIDPEWNRNGLLIISPDEQRAALEWAERHRQNLAQVDPQQIAELEPGAIPCEHDGLWMPDVAQVRNPRIVKALHAELLRLGVNIVEQTPVERIVTGSSGFECVETAQGNYHADNLVVCAGAWTRQLLSVADNSPEIEPVRGQMILLRAEPGVVTRISLRDDRYVIPRRDGRILFGSTLEYTGFEKITTHVALEELHRILLERYPTLASFPVEKQWAGLRPGSPAGIPYIGRHPSIDRLYINAGHFRNGVVLGPASARLIRNLVMDETPILPLAPYALTANRD